MFRGSGGLESRTSDGHNGDGTLAGRTLSGDDTGWNGTGMDHTPASLTSEWDAGSAGFVTAASTWGFFLGLGLGCCVPREDFQGRTAKQQQIPADSPSKLPGLLPPNPASHMALLPLCSNRGSNLKLTPF
jgi:hypothetical protein